jgi:flagellar basal body-associated protein FliL
MWLYLIAGVLILFGIVGGIFTGGIFTIVILPLGVVVLVGGVVAAMWSRATQASAGGEASASGTEHPPLRHTAPPETSTVNTPEDLADARRAQQ